MAANGNLPSIASIERVRAQLNELQHASLERFRKSLQAVALLNELFEEAGIQSVLVGGQAVELYTMGQYSTADVDLVLNGYQVAGEILEQVGFEGKQQGARHWYHPGLGLPIEIPDSVLAGSMEKVLDLEVGDGHHVYVIGIEDLIIDRLESGVHHRSSSDMEWAAFLMRSRWDDIDWNYIETRAGEPRVDVLAAVKRLREEIGSLIDGEGV